MLLGLSLDLELSYVLIRPWLVFILFYFILGIDMLIDHFIAIICLFLDSSKEP